MRGIVSVGLGVLCVLAVGCAKPPDDGILSAVRETVTSGVPAGAHTPEIQSLVVTSKKRLFWGRPVWTAEVEAEVRSGADDPGAQDGIPVKEPFRVVITRPDGWHYEVQHDRTLPGGA